MIRIRKEKENEPPLPAPLPHKALWRRGRRSCRAWNVLSAEKRQHAWSLKRIMIRITSKIKREASSALRRSTDDRINMRLLFENAPVRKNGTTNLT